MLITMNMDKLQQAILLLTARLSSTSDEIVRPLSNREWHRLHEWMRFLEIDPEMLLALPPEEVLKGWNHTSITHERIKALLQRKEILFASLEKWRRAGIWQVTILDEEYPEVLKKRLDRDAPTILFGCGEPLRMKAGGLSVVGSRKTTADVLAYSRKLGEMAADHDVQVVSGGARGVDQAAMLGCLEQGGESLGVLADSLFKALVSTVFSKYLLQGCLTLITPFSPEVGFSAVKAIQRNKLIYCLSDVGFAVHSGLRGGTWSGVQEAVRKRWIPIWVRKMDDPDAGNSELITAGALAAPTSINDVDFNYLMKAELQLDLFDLMEM